MNTDGINTGDVHILIAEDSPTQAERLKHTLERNGYQVTLTSNGRRAADAAKAHKPTLLISDIIMPEMDGYELCRQIKSDPELKNIPVILLTTLSDPKDVIRGLECGADNFVIKPYDERFLLTRIQFVLLNREMRQSDSPSEGVEIYFDGQRHVIRSDRLQILNLLLSTYEAAVQQNHELIVAKDELRTANITLEAVNKELESFSYSVSHDLRSPLRAVAGFVRALADDYSDRLDDKGNNLLSRVQTACTRMGQLIEDLLNLARLARTEIRREQVDLGDQARSILNDLKNNQPERNVDLQIADGLMANGDARLLRIALENLLGNAWKFTAKLPIAVIELGLLHQGEDRVFFVRDNGAGFDMNYADKLFGAFQRLHSSSDFPGTGIGLATVQRIIRRHGGRIWAESAIGAGTTFFFVL